MEKEVKYIGFYDLLNAKYKRNSSLAAVNKMNYIAKAMVGTGKKVKVISPSWYIDEHVPTTKQQTISISENTLCVQSPSFCTKNKFTGKIKSYISLIWLFYYLLINVKRDEEVLVYHSIAIIKPILLAKKIKKFKMILEVEEIYTDVIDYGNHIRKLEFKMIEEADKYIFPTELLNESINIKNKPYSIIYGTYQVEEDRKYKFDDNRIHVVYAGTLDPRKGGASAAAAAEYLDENYHVHIIGFGSKEEKQNLKCIINEVSQKTKCTVTFDGLYKGEEYIRFLQKCDIGLSTQMPNAKYNDTSFPSKVLSYMSNGLRVVSIRIKALEKSMISDLLYYYDEDCPKAIAKAIKSINLSDKYDSRNKIKSLDKDFRLKIKELLER